MSAYVPDVCETFQHCMCYPRGEGKCRYPGSCGFRVTGWLKPSRVFSVTPGGVASLPDRDWGDLDPVAIRILEETTAQFPPRGAGPDNLPLTWCTREEAVFVSGYGVCGVIVHIRDVVVDGTVANRWSPELVEHAHRSALMLVGERLS
jgi:hypothetical protein